MTKQKLQKKYKRMKKCLRAIVAFEPHEVIKDDFAYDRLLQNMKSAAKAGLKK